MSGREEILRRVRARLGRTEVEGTRRAELERMLTAPEARLVPARAQVDGERLVEIFRERCGMRGMTVELLASDVDVPTAVARYLAAQQLPLRITLAHAPSLAAHDFRGAGLATDTATAPRDLETCVTLAFAGIAETGTLAVHSGRESSMWTNFLADNLVVLLARADLVPSMEDVWQRLRARFGAREMPRGLSLVSSVSMTGDIGQILVRGAHGPLRLHVLLI